jgi:hypothetical protein
VGDSKVQSGRGGLSVSAEKIEKMPILYACILLEMLRRSSVPSWTTIAALAALQSAAYG